MKVEQKIWSQAKGWEKLTDGDLSEKAQWVLAFGPEKFIKGKVRYEELKALYPNADIVLSSTVAGTMGANIYSDSLLLCALYFEKTKIQAVEIDINDVKDSFDAGAHLSASLDKDELKSLVVLSDGLPLVNGSHLLTGIYFNLAEHVAVTGGLSSNFKFGSALLGLNKPPAKGKIIGIGFSGEHIRIGHGLDGGWTPFGTERFVNKSKDNVVYKLDHLTPYDFYRQYLDDIVGDLDMAVTNFPLGIRLENSNKRLIRHALKINKKDGSMVFSGDLPEGSWVRMMKTNISSLIDSASTAARTSLSDYDIDTPDFSLVMNCVGRDSVLKEWVPEENEAIIHGIGSNTPVMGCYSHGEFSPLEKNQKSELQNQSIIITSFKEI